MSANITGIKITQLNDIGANIAPSSLLPIVDMSNLSNPVTDKANLQIVGNLILSGAGGSYFSPAAQATLAQTVTNSSQPNITSLGILTSMKVTDVSALNIPGGYNGYFLQTDGNGNVSWTVGGSGNSTSPGGNNTQVQFNANGTFGGTNGFVFNSTSNAVTVSGNITSYGNVSGTNVVTATVTNPNDGLYLHGYSNVYVVANAGTTWTFGGGGAVYWPVSGNNLWVIEPNSNNEFEIRSTTGVVITSDTTNTNSHFTFDQSGIFTAPSNVNLLGTRLNIGPNALDVNYVSPTIVVADSDPSYIQTAQINIDANGSSDFAAYGANSDGNTAFVDMGFAGFNYADPNYSLTPAGTGYLISQAYANGLGGQLVLATGYGGSSSDIIFGTGGFMSNNEFARFDHSNNVFHLTRSGTGIKYNDNTVQTTAFVGTANTASTVTGNSQPNITSVGNLTSLYISGNTTARNLTLTNGTNYYGDYSNLNPVVRPAFITNIPNSSTGVYAAPNGTSTGASWQATNSSDIGNASKILIAATDSNVQLVSGINGTGTYLPLDFWNSAKQQMRLYPSGGFYVGQTPSDPGSNNAQIQGTLTANSLSATGASITGNISGANITGTHFGDGGNLSNIPTPVLSTRATSVGPGGNLFLNTTDAFVLVNRNGQTTVNIIVPNATPIGHQFIVKESSGYSTALTVQSDDTANVLTDGHASVSIAANTYNSVTVVVATADGGSGKGLWITSSYA